MKFRRYGGPEVLEILEVDRPTAGPGEVVIEVVAAAMNPGEIAIREGAFATMWPAHFPEGQGNDFAGYIAQVGKGVGRFEVGDQVVGYLPRAAQADFVLAPVSQVVPKPHELSWEQAAAITGVGATAWAAVEAIAPHEGDTVVIAGAAGGVGSIATQLVQLRGASVVGTASAENAEFLRGLGAEPMLYGEGLFERMKARIGPPVTALIDTVGRGNVDIALALGVSPGRINTLVDGGAIQRYGVRSEAQESTTPQEWELLARMAASGAFHVPIEQVYPLEQVRQAYIDVATRHGRGKRILRMRAD
ncbi:NADP-dependent oxidoreductase [Actinopolymorpha pittospori]